jgi:hypothetical protein
MANHGSHVPVVMVSAANQTDAVRDHRSATNASIALNSAGLSNVYIISNCKPNMRIND